MSTAAPAGGIDPKRIDRRELRFTCLDCLRGELERVERAHAAGTLRTLGNWSAGKILGHLAAWMDYPYDGFPPEMRPPLALRLLMRLFRGRVLKGRMPPGVRIPGVEGGTFGTEEMSVQEGLARLRRSIDRLEHQPPRHPSPLFGALDHAQWIRLNLGHAESHLGCLTLS